MNNHFFPLYNFRGNAVQLQNFVVSVQAGSQGNFLCKQAGPSMGKAQSRITKSAATSSDTTASSCGNSVGRCGQCVEISTSDGNKCDCSKVNPCYNGQTSYGGVYLDNVTYSLYASNPSDCSVVYQVSFINTFIKVDDGLIDKTICEIMVYLLGWYFSCPKAYNWIATAGAVPYTATQTVTGGSVFYNNWVTNIPTSTDSNGCFKSPTVYNCNNIPVPAANYFNIKQKDCALCLTSTPP